MKIRTMTVLFVSGMTLAGVAGCTAMKKMSPTPTAGAEETPKKEYQWRDMSAGQNFYGQQKSNQPNTGTTPANSSSPPN